MTPEQWIIQLRFEAVNGEKSQHMREWLNEIADLISTLTAERDGLALQVVQMREALEVMKLRACFIGWPAEKFWDAGSGKMIPDWRDELQQTEAALALTPTEAEELRKNADRMNIIDEAIAYVNGSTFEAACLPCVNKVLSEIKAFQRSAIAAQRREDSDDARP